MRRSRLRTTALAGGHGLAMSEQKSINELNADLFQPEEDDHHSDPKAARQKAMDYLARREYGHEELVRKLSAAGFDVDIAAPAVDLLAGEGLQSDTRYAENFVQSRINQGKGPGKSGYENLVIPCQRNSPKRLGRCDFSSSADSSRSRCRLPSVRVVMTSRYL